MASNFEDLLTCDICLDTYDEPKLLPACGHVFCEKCLLPLANNNTITCPKCRKDNAVVENNVKELNTDRNLKEMITNLLCLDCGSINKLAKLCDQCYMNVCPTCISSHNSTQKCELLASIRVATKSLPTRKEGSELDSMKEEWENFKENNQKQKKAVNEQMIELIKSLQEKKASVLKKFDEYDQLAADTLKWMEEMKETEVRLKDLKNAVTEMKSESVAQAQASMTQHNRSISRKKDLLTKLVPHSLSIIRTSRLRDEIAQVGRWIIRRKAGDDVYPDVMWSADDASLRELDDVSGWPSSEHSVEGKMQVMRNRNGCYELQVIDKTDSKKVLKSLKWNNRAPDALTPTLINSYWTHVPWVLSNGDRTDEYSTGVEDDGARNDFLDLLEHSIFADVEEAE